MSLVERLLSSYRLTLAVGLSIFLAYGVFVFTHPAAAFNYQLYRYFAEQANAGVDVFQLDPATAKFNPGYLDFAPAGLLEYRVLFYVEDHWIPHFYHLFQLILAAINVLLVISLLNYLAIPPVRRLCIVFILCISPAWLLLATVPGEDKMLYATGPLLLVWLSKRNMTLFVIWAAIFAGVTVYGVLLLPIVAAVWFSQRQPGAPRFRELATLAVGGAILAGLLLVYFPDSLVMFHNRMIRGTAQPFWFSVWRFAPDLYSPTANSILIVLAALVIYLIFALRRIDMFTALISVQFVFFLFANYLKYSRFETYIFLPLLTIRGPAKFYFYFFMVIVQLHYDFLMRIQDSAIDPEMWSAGGWLQVLLANMTLVGFLAIMALEALDGSSRSLNGSKSPPRVALGGLT
jgi:hypothetical protein